VDGCRSVRFRFRLDSRDWAAVDDVGDGCSRLKKGLGNYDLWGSG
jgi:hypothetical protein